MKSDLHDMEVIYQHRTEKAVCVRQYEGADDVWIPLSACEIEAKEGELRRGCIAVLTAPEIILNEKGLI